MTTAPMPFAPPAAVDRLPLLAEGDHLDQPTFHARYEAMPRGTKAELIGGVVYMALSVGRLHCIHHKAAVYWLGHFERFTPGVETMDNGTTILAEDSEPQPDVALRVMVGGRSRVTPDGYVAGCPELLCEVANSTEAYDLHAKRRDYERYGAQEYVAVVVRSARVVWFARDGNRLVEALPDADGTYRSRAFPGLWLDPAALLSGDLARLSAVIEQGVATPAHAAFAADLRGRSGS